MFAWSSTEAEYLSLASCAAEVLWITNLPHELHVECPFVPQIFYDNISATYLSVNLIFHSRMKHNAIDYHFVHDQAPSLFLTCPSKINWLILLPSHYRLLSSSTYAPRSVSPTGAPSYESLIKLSFTTANLNNLPTSSASSTEQPQPSQHLLDSLKACYNNWLHFNIQVLLCWWYGIWRTARMKFGLWSTTSKSSH